MTPSPACIALIQSFEQCRFAAYLPTPQDRPTIGWGTTGEDIQLGMTWTQQQCDERFASDLSRFAEGVSAALTGETRQNQFDAMVSLAYNIGPGAFKASTLLRRHNAGDFDAAAAQFVAWSKQAGQILQGLVRRRAAEAAMYRGA
jgi:lysozyme